MAAFPPPKRHADMKAAIKGSLEKHKAKHPPAKKGKAPPPSASDEPEGGPNPDNETAEAKLIEAMRR